MSRWKNMNYQSTMARLQELDPASQANQKLLFEVCTQSMFNEARQAAIDMLKNPSLLVKIACHEQDQDICRAAIEKLTDDASLLEVAEYIYDDHYLCSLAISRINDQEMLLHVALSHAYDECRIVAIKRLDDQDSLLEIIKQNKNPEVRIAALESLTNQQVLAEIAAKDPSSWVRRSAVGKITDSTLLAHIAMHNSLRTIRLAALLRLLEMGKTRSFPQETIEQLLVLLDDSTVVESVIELAQQAGIDWMCSITEITVEVLYEAYIAGKGWHRNQVIEQSVKRLYELRPDLQESLLSYQWVNPYTEITVNLA